MAVVDIQELTADELRSDVVVVGSGLAGIAIAQSLANIGRRFTVLESGNQDNPDAQLNVKRSPFAVADYGYAKDYTQLHIRRQFGGGSAVWGGWCAIPRSITFEERGLGTSYGWPITRESLQEYINAQRRTSSLISQQMFSRGRVLC